MFESILNITDTAIASYVFDLWTAFVVDAKPWIRLMMILFITLTGYLILVGRLNITMSEFLPRAFKGLFIYVLITNVGLMTSFLYNIFIYVPQAIATYVVSSFSTVPITTETGINSAIGQLFDQGMQVVTIIMDQGGWHNLMAYIYGGLVFLCILAITGYTLFLLVLSKIAVGIMLGLAPFFIILYLFGHTKGLFEGWLRQLTTYALVPIIVYALYAMILVITLQPMNALFTAATMAVPTITQIAPFLIVNLIAIILLQQVMAWAGALGGGLQLNTAGAARAVGGFAKKRAGIVGKNYKRLRQSSTKSTPSKEKK